MFKARLARFYGWSPDVIENLDVDRADSYWKCIDVIESREMLMKFTQMDYPHLKDDKRRELFKKFDSKTKVKKSETKKITNKELMDILSRR